MNLLPTLPSNVRGRYQYEVIKVGNIISLKKEFSFFSFSQKNIIKAILVIVSAPISKWDPKARAEKSTEAIRLLLFLPAKR